MSGIRNNTSFQPIDYQRQIDDLDQNATLTEAELKRLESENPGVVNAYRNARDTVQRTLDWARTVGLTDTNGKPLQFNTLQEFHDLCQKGGIKDKDGNLVNGGKGFIYSAPNIGQMLTDLAAAKGPYDRLVGPALDRANNAQNQLNTLRDGLTEAKELLAKMMQLLESGDIESAVMLMNTTRVKALDAQLQSRLAGASARAIESKRLGDLMKDEQGKLAGVTGTDSEKQAKRDGINATIQGYKNQLDQLNSDSQLDMIGIQQLMSKRNEAFDTMTNMLSKIQKTIDGIISNYR